MLSIQCTHSVISVKEKYLSIYTGIEKKKQQRQQLQRESLYRITKLFDV